MEAVILRVHSFIDVITNSSTEIYVEATQNTISSVKELVDNLFKLSGSDLKCDDVFDISLENDGDEEEESSDWDESYPEVDLIVIPKEGVTSEAANSAARILSGLTDLFSINSCYNG